ncbi:oligosaccharide flippase family protein [Nitratidesulfovibrio sp.]|uniref:lipopolysaccharide biosynthesis protein n=1 Tax=Nitratidesulfovibrio sp. TaxID=2802297 RepID=UPI0033424288
MSTLRYFARNSVIRVLSFAVGVGFALFVTPKVVGTLGKATYGVWVLISSVLCYYLLLEGGVMQAVAKYASAAFARGDRREVDRVCTAGVALHALSCVAALCVTALLAFFAGAFATEFVSPERLRLCLVTYSACLAFMFLFRTFTGILMAEMRWTFIALLSMARSALTSITVLIWIRPDNGLLLLAVVNGAGFLLEGMVCLYCVRCGRMASFRPSLFDLSLARNMLVYGFTFTMSEVGDSFRYRSQNYVIALFMGVREVAIFSIAMQFIGYFISLMQSAFGIMVPYFSRMQVGSDSMNIGPTLLHALRLSYVMASFIGMCLVFYGRDFIVLWLGEGFSASYDALVPLTIGAVLSLGMLPADGFLLGTARHRVLARCALAEGGCILLLSVALAGPFGMAGVAWAYCIAATVFRAGIVPYLVFTHAGLSMADYGRLVAGVLATHVVPQVLCYLALRGSLGNGYLQLALLVCTQALLVVVIQMSMLRLHRSPA